MAIDIDIDEGGGGWAGRCEDEAGVDVGVGPEGFLVGRDVDDDVGGR